MSGKYIRLTFEGGNMSKTLPNAVQTFSHFYWIDYRVFWKRYSVIVLSFHNHSLVPCWGSACQKMWKYDIEKVWSFGPTVVRMCKHSLNSFGTKIHVHIISFITVMNGRDLFGEKRFKKLTLHTTFSYTQNYTRLCLPCSFHMSTLM